MNETEILLAITQMDDPRHRETFLNSVCGEDHELKRKIERLLQALPTCEVGLDQLNADIPQQFLTVRQPETATHPPPTRPTDDAFPSGFRFQHFRIVGRLGVGGMGEVYPRADRCVRSWLPLILRRPPR